LVVEFGDVSISPHLRPRLARRLDESHLDGIVETVPTFRSLGALRSLESAMRFAATRRPDEA
jgi:hypothetical protein